jgi:DNA-binding TFAR19-related protein (PDSD5 family)
MEDDELAAIRARRLAELQGQSGGSSPKVNLIFLFLV